MHSHGNFPFYVHDLRILPGKTHPQKKTQALAESINMDIWVIGTLNPLFIRGSYNQIKISKK